MIGLFLSNCFCLYCVDQGCCNCFLFELVARKLGLWKQIWGSDVLTHKYQGCDMGFKRAQQGSLMIQEFLKTLAFVSVCKTLTFYLANDCIPM